jgi:hypothetical protein
MVFSLVDKFIPAGIQFAFIGSQSYFIQPEQLSDYDFLFLERDKVWVTNHLVSQGIELKEAGYGSVKFDVELAPTVRCFSTGYRIQTYNFCFVPTQTDFDAWTKSTTAMKAIYGTSVGNSMPRDKSTRLELFSNLVQAFGGTKPSLVY